MSRTASRVGRTGGLVTRAVMVAAVLGMGALALSPALGRAAGPTPTFAATYISNTLAGGEPFVIYSHAGNDLVYAAHEGTTHIDKNGLTTADSACDILPPKNGIPSGFVCAPYNNHINQWYSTDGGATWTLDSAATNPLAGTADTGFSDPSLTEDAVPATSGPQNIYDTGIDLANDALYASNDGGKTWAGTPQCTEGDRPWLAGGQNGEVFLATDLEAPAANGAQGHAYFHGLVEETGTTIATITCNQDAISDPAGGDAQDYYDRNGDASGAGDLGDILEGASGFSDGGFGIGVLPNASKAWPATTPATNTGAPTGAFTDYEGTNCTTHAEVGNPTPATASSDANLCTELGPIDPELAIDNGNTTYVVWATYPHSSDPNDTNGCTGATTAGAPGILPNSIYMMYTKDEGKSWSAPLTIADSSTSGGNTVLWPFVTAGAAGNVAVVWYQSTQLTDPDCDSAALQANGKATPWTLQEATIFNATDPSTVYPPSSVNAFPTNVCCNTLNNPVAHPDGVFHVGGVCESGTTCVATGQDRRLGDYFTDALDQNGCLLIATGDTDMVDATTGGQLDLSRPVLLEQASGQSLTNPEVQCTSAIAVASASTPEVFWPPLLLVGGGALGVGLLGRRRRRV